MDPTRRVKAQAAGGQVHRARHPAGKVDQVKPRKVQCLGRKVADDGHVVRAEDAARRVSLHAGNCHGDIRTAQDIDRSQRLEFLEAGCQENQCLLDHGKCRSRHGIRQREDASDLY